MTTDPAAAPGVLSAREVAPDEMGIRVDDSEPDADDVAPHRTLPRARFRHLFTHDTTRGPSDPRQPVTRRVLDPRAAP